ncbi:protein phosphatase 1 regulatory subunit 3C-B-like isoform X5 [Xyrichtys novacula]|nr:protein phosphatase 1 regulatory subunit 3C-B-like isoform X5 [Xyrichtys novacula]
MPVDVAMRICLASSPPLHTLLSNYDNALLRQSEPLRPCLSSGRCNDTFRNNVTTATTPSMAINADEDSSAAWARKKTKKNVVFADSRGLALTAVYVFNESEDDLLTDLQFHLSEIEDAAARLHLGDDSGPSDPGSVLVLDFTQPDYLDLRTRLKTQQVCLETCSVQDRLLSGTVQVQNLCFHKSVWIRITFDSWRSFQDLPCRYLNTVYAGPDTDTFSFSVLVPESIQTSNRVEFCIQFQTPDRTFWDNNQGNNYRLVLLDPNSGTRGTGLEIQGDQKKEGLDFDPFGSPRTSAGVFPEWQSWVRVETRTPYW